MRWQKSIYILLVLLISTVATLIFVNPQFALINWHEFMHASIVFNIMNGVVPPEDTLLAGYPLKYPWAHHYLVSWLCQIGNISPPIGFALLNILALAVSAWAIFKTAQLLHPLRQTGIFAVFLSIFCTSIFFIQELKRFGNDILPIDERVLPLHKFAHGNGNGLGFGLFFICLFFLIRLFANREKSYINGVGIGVSIAATAFLYPIYWLAMGISCVLVCLGQAIAKRGKNGQSILIVLLAVFFGSAIASPYLHSINAGRASTAAMSLNFQIQNRLITLFLVSSLPLLILWVKRQKLKTLLHNRSSEVLTLIYAAISLSLLYTFITIPIETQYKFLMLLVGIISILIAPFFASFNQENSLFAKPIIVLLFLPTVLMFTGMFMQINFADTVHTSGVEIRHNDTRMDKLYSWIATNTPVDAVVVDSFRTIPVLSRRSLYISTDFRRKQDPSWKKFDGWSMNSRMISTQVFGQDQEVVKKRLQNAIALLTPNSEAIVNAAAESIKQEFPQRQVIVIVRDPSVKSVFDINQNFAKIFEESAISVYKIAS
ncbi:DUF2298 domain-containing protein [Anabaena sp. CCY 0017]|uniref:DUF2298 domain-containing protein n=1 Tax=Anabaena sp. CCY 0017 TaxID=3103866 RepID=UPI0039C7430F